MKRLSLLIFLLSFPIFLHSAGNNAGFVSGIWYSKTPFFAGETIKIHTVIYNNSGFDIKGTIKFFDNGEAIGQTDFSALNGRLIEKWIEWKVTEGNHKIQAKIFDSKKISDSTYVALSIGSSGIDEIYADLDTDNDGIGNREDTDDDNDGTTDKEEEKLGTNPLAVDKKEEVAQKSDDSNDSLEEGRELTEKFVVTPAKEVSRVVLTESKPVIEKIGNLLVEKQKLVEKQIEEDKKTDNRENLASAVSSGFYDKIREKLPPTFRILYNWLLRFLIILFKIWWIPLIIFILIMLRILLGVYRRIRRR